MNVPTDLPADAHDGRTNQPTAQHTALAAARPPLLRRMLRRSASPVIIVVALAAVGLWIMATPLDSIEQRTLNMPYIVARIREHLVLTFSAAVLVAVIAIPAGIAAYMVKSKVFRSVVLALGNIGQATPAVGVVILLAIWWQTGFFSALIALVAYSFLPVLRNTLVGLEQVPDDVRESARGMGMTTGQVLRRIELPLASSVIFAGFRTSLVFCVGVATIATFINAGGLGDMLVNGLKLQRFPVIVVGAVLVACIALLIDWLASLAEDAMRGKGVESASS